MVKRQLAMLLAGIGILTVGISTPVSAEEYEPAGYHVYDVQEEEATDTWYGIARGNYLQAGIAKVKKGSTIRSPKEITTVRLVYILFFRMIL